MKNSKRRNSRHDRYDREFLSVSNLLDSVKKPTKVVNVRQVIINKALAMTHRTLTNGKEFRQLQSVLRQVYTLQNNIPFVKEAPYLLVVAPKGFLSHMNRLIQSCNDYIDETPLLALDKSIQKMKYLPSDIDLKGVLFYDRKGVNSMWTEKENMISITKEEPVITKEITTVHELKQIQSNTTHQLEDIL